MWECWREVGSRPSSGPTMSLDKRISTQSWEKSQTSKRSVSAASAKLFVSSGVLRLKRRTMSPLYRATVCGGACRSASDDRPLSLPACDLGKPQSEFITRSDIRRHCERSEGRDIEKGCCWRCCRCCATCALGDGTAETREYRKAAGKASQAACEQRMSAG